MTLQNETNSRNDWPAIFSAIAIAHMENPQNVGSIEHPDGVAIITGSCGDTMEFWIRVKKGIISDIKFWTDGCETTIAAGSITTVLSRYKPVGEAFKISQQDILDALGGLPEDSQHCALLAARTLKAALSDFMAFKNDPWKRIYHRNTAIY